MPGHATHAAHAAHTASAAKHLTEQVVKTAAAHAATQPGVNVEDFVAPTMVATKDKAAEKKETASPAPPPLGDALAAVQPHQPPRHAAGAAPSPLLSPGSSSAGRAALKLALRGVVDGLGPEEGISPKRAIAQLKERSPWEN